MAEMMTVFDFVWRGVHFDGRARWRFAVFFRYEGRRTPNLVRWQGAGSYYMATTGVHVFRRTVEVRQHADVYLVDLERERVVGYAQSGKVRFVDPINYGITT
jgi:hypothetical protein